jgi:hypothetical protein
MTLRELINSVLDRGHFSHVTQFIHKEYYTDQPKSEQGPINCSYQAVIGELLELRSKKAEYAIYVNEKEDRGEKFVDVSLYCDEDEEAYALDLTDWADLIDAKIKNDLNTLTWQHELLGHILWEITFYGFTQAKVELSKDKMEQLVDEVRKTFGEDDVEEVK